MATKKYLCKQNCFLSNMTYYAKDRVYELDEKLANKHFAELRSPGPEAPPQQPQRPTATQEAYAMPSEEVVVDQPRRRQTRKRARVRE